MHHVFGKPEKKPPTEGERFCNEPLVPGVTYVRVYHAQFMVLAGGNFKCTHCGERFFDVEEESRPLDSPSTCSAG